MKKKIFYSVLSFVIALSGFGLASCGDDTGSINPYEQYVDTIAEFKEATTLFKEGATSGLKFRCHQSRFEKYGKCRGNCTYPNL